jgi:hypothetical protein
LTVWRDKYTLSITFLVIAITLLSEAIFLQYLVERGFKLKSEYLAIGGFTFSVPLPFIVVAGVLLVIIASWSYTLRGSELRSASNGSLRLLRLARNGANLIAVFLIALYSPYVIGSNIFWSSLAGAVRNITQLVQFAQYLYTSIAELMQLDNLYKFAISQNIAAFSFALVSIILGRGQRRVRRRR